MDLGPLRALVLELNLSAHGVPVRVIRPAPDDDPLTSRGIWMTVETGSVPGGAVFTRKDAIRVLAMPRHEVPTLPRGTEILAPKVTGGCEESWTVDSVDLTFADHVRVMVLPTPD